MSANPSIKEVSATKDATSTLILVLLENGIKGMVQLRAYLSASCVAEDAAMRRDWCVESSYSQYIPELYKLVNALKSATTSATSACLRAHICNVGEDCETMSCTTWNSSYSSMKSNILIENAFGLTPIEVSGLTLTPGDKSISATWGDINQTTSIWAYEILLEQGATQLASGARIKNVMLISNLINGSQYKVSVRAVSFDGYKGPWISKTATAGECEKPLCSINIIGK